MDRREKRNHSPKRPSVPLLALVLAGAFASGNCVAGGEATDISIGRSVFFHRCVACHEPLSKEGLTQDELSIYDNSLPASADEMTARGPVLFGLLGRTAGTQPDFTYSPALKAAGLTWTDDNLRQFLQKPAAFLPGTTMHFNGLKRDGELDALMAYLHTVAAASP